MHHNFHLESHIKKIGREVLLLDAGEDNPRNSEGAFLELNDGRILFVYTRFTGDSWSDFASAALVAITSDNKGETWSDGRVVLKKRPEDTNIMSVSLLRMKNGDIGLFFLRKTPNYDCLPCMMRSSDEGETWTEPKLCSPDHGYYVTNNDRVVRLSNGRLILPANLHVRNENDEPTDVGAAHFFLSDDDGETWREAQTHLELPYAHTWSGLQESGVVELRDGTVQGWARTGLGRQYLFASHDGGETWSAPEPSWYFTSAWAPMSIKRLLDGRLMAVLNPIPEYTGQEQYQSWGRTPLACLLSSDDGKTYDQTFLLEDDPNHGFCYTAILPMVDRVLLAYCCNGSGEAPLCSTKIKVVMMEELS